MTTTRTTTRPGRPSGSAPMTLTGWLWSILTHSPRGLWVVVSAVFHFCRDERRAARIDDMRGTGHYKQIDEEERHQRAMKIRTGIVAATLAAAGGSLWAAPPTTWTVWSQLAGAAAIVVLVAVLGLLGRAAAELPVAPELLQTRQGEPPIKQDLIVNALAHSGISRIEAAIADEGPRAIRFLTPVAKDGSGVAVELELPMGASVRDVLADKPFTAFAGGLSRPAERVHIERGATERHLLLYVADTSMGDRGSIPWTPAPSADREPKRVDIFEPIPVGVNLRGKPAFVRLFTSLGAIFGTVAGMTGSGKSNTITVLVAAAALDPRPEVRIYDAKGSPEFEEIGPALCHRYQIGATHEDLEVLAGDLEDLASTEIPARAERKRKVRAENPGITSEYGAHYAGRRDWGLHPIIVCIDENIPFTIDKANRTEAKIKERIRAAVVQVASTGRSFGVVVLIGGQAMNDERIPKGYRDNAGLRIGMAARSATTANQYLGDGSVGEGFRCDRLRLPDDMGVGYVEGDGAKTSLVKFADLSDPELRARIAATGRAMRAAEGRLTGAAAGEFEPDEIVPDIVDQAVFVWPADRELLALTELLDLLAHRYRGEFVGLDEVGLGKALRGAGVVMTRDGRPVQITSGPMKGRKAVHLDDAMDVLDSRTHGHDTTTVHRNGGVPSDVLPDHGWLSHPVSRDDGADVPDHDLGEPPHR